MDVEKCNSVSTVGRIVSTGDGPTSLVAGQRPDVQQAVKELARGMSSPTNIHWVWLKQAMRLLVNKRTSIWKFEPTANEARDNELTATSDIDWGGCVKTRKSTTGIVLRYEQNARMHPSELGRS